MNVTVRYCEPDLVLRIDGADAFVAGHELVESIIMDPRPTQYSWQWVDGVFSARIRPHMWNGATPFDAGVLQQWLTSWFARWPDARVEFIAA